MNGIDTGLAPKMQRQVMRCYTISALAAIQRQTSNINQQSRMLASFHYSGNIQLGNNTRPQSYNGYRYPSIASYTQSVCQAIN